ncbi:protease modulator HflC [Acuticoccus mangrovi]|uniref:Protease modulator HflC n=1 Tax=Acuticoccus mangrovi TaxID=2796142 RepID=A0A934MG23_9HYPH|nr:protease modulator HflC [Acuticoccus mangrovi]MBJ3775525.1 protease modulator HflC [Acuticoccus mangrovi]
MRAGLIGILIVIAVVVVVALNSLFVTTPTQQALVLQFGEVRQAIRQPGLNVKIPLIQDVLFLDKRILDLNVPTQEIIAADQKRLVVDAFMRYRVANPVRFYQTVNNVREGAARLSTFVQASLRAVLADATFQAIVRDDRQALTQRIAEDVARRAQDIGVEIVDVRIRRADLPEANSEAIYRRMRTEREQEATEIRARGREAAARVEAAADRTATVLRAEADREAEQIRGEGDARKNAIFARAYTVDPQFFAFYRAMQAYETGLKASDTRLILSPDADFFRYFNDPLGRTAELPPAEVAEAPQPNQGPLPDIAAEVPPALDRNADTKDLLPEIAPVPGAEEDVPSMSDTSADIDAEEDAALDEEAAVDAGEPSPAVASEAEAARLEAEEAEESAAQETGESAAATDAAPASEEVSPASPDAASAGTPAETSADTEAAPASTDERPVEPAQ